MLCFAHQMLQCTHCSSMQSYVVQVLVVTTFHARLFADSSKLKCVSFKVFPSLVSVAYHSASPMVQLCSAWYNHEALHSIVV